MSQQQNDVFFLTLFAEYLTSEDKFRLQRVCTKWRKILLPFSWETIHVTKHFERAGQALAFQQFKDNGKFIRSIKFTKEAPGMIFKLLSFTFILESFEKMSPSDTMQTVTICDTIAKKYPNILHIRLVYYETPEKQPLIPFAFKSLTSLNLVKPPFNDGDHIIRSFISGSGSSLKHLQYNTSIIGEELMNNLNQYCPNLFSLKLVGKITSVAFDAMNQYPSKIRDLNFDIHNKTSAALDSYTLNSDHFPHLTTFTIRSDADLAERVTGRHPTFEAPLICLKSLNIYTMTMAGFQSIPDFFPALSSLTIFKCRHVTNSVVRRLILNLPSLENLQLSGESFDDGAFDTPLGRPHLKLHRLSLTESGGLGVFFVKWLFNNVPKLLWLDISYVPIRLPSALNLSAVAAESKFHPTQLFFLDASFSFDAPASLIKLIAELSGLSILQLADEDPAITMLVKNTYPNLEIRIREPRDE